MSETPRKSLRELALRSSVIELSGYAASQILRLGSTLILSRLLFPEAFGLAALIAIFNQGLTMLSDVGIEQSVVRSARGDEEKYLNTAWTIHVMRGVVLWLVSCALAWPLAVMYSEPQLLYLLPVGAMNVLIAGFASTSLFTLRRRLQVWQINGIELAAQAISLAVVIPTAYVWHSVWAIVAGGLAAALTKTLASYWVQVGYRNRFEWDPSTKAEIMDFGKWIFGSSALSFASMQGDRLLLAKFIGFGPLGIYSIAVYLSDALGSVVTKVTHGVLYPVFSQVARETPERVRAVYYKTRLRLDVFSLIALGGLMSLSETVVRVLYDARYAEAGWMLKALCIRVAMGCVLIPCETCLFSMGHTRFGFFQNIARSIWVLAGVPIGWALWGLEGVVWATALAQIPVLLVLWIPFYRMGLLRLDRELLAVVLFAVGAGVGAVVLPYADMLVHAVLGR